MTVTTIKESNKSLVDVSIINPDWLDEIEHSFHPSPSIDNLETIDFYDHHSIIQSYLEPDCIQQQQLPPLSLPPSLPQKSKFSQMKSRMKRVFGFSGVNSNNKSLPVFSTPSTTSTATNEIWAPSIDSICSSTTTAAATFQDTASTCSTKNYNRHSCGFSAASFKQNKPRATTIITPPVVLAEVKEPLPRPVKSILKKHRKHQQQLQQPPPLILPRRRHSGGLEQRRKQQRWSMAPSKRLSVVTMLKRKKSSRREQEEGYNTTTVKFNKCVNVHETWSKSEYDRSSDPDAVCTRLTANIAQQIKQELNHFKLHEMSVHDSSRIHTHFFL